MYEYKDSAPLSEVFLMGGSAAGDRESYARLYQDHKNKLIEQAAAELCDGDEEEAAAVIQEAFTDVLANIRDIDRTMPFAENIMDAARDRIISARHQYGAAVGEFVSFAKKALKREVAEDADPLEILADRERIEESVSALRALFALSHAGDRTMSKGLGHLFEIVQQGSTIAEIARREKITPAKVQTRVENACASLQHILRPVTPAAS